MGSADSREIAELAKQLGFTVEGVTGSGHLMLVHESGRKVTLASTPSDFRNRRNAIALLEGVAKQRLPRPGHRRSRKATRPSGFDVRLAAHETAQWHAAHDDEVTELLGRRERLIAECRELARNRARLRDIPARLESIRELEERLRLRCVPLAPFDPYSLAPQ